MSEQPDQTAWWCERCHASGIIRMDRFSNSVYDAIRLLRANHDNHDLATWKKCEFDTAKVRVEPVSVNAPRDPAVPPGGPR